MCFVEGLLFLDRRHRCRNTSEEAFNGDSLRTVSPVSQGAWTFFSLRFRIDTSKTHILVEGVA